MPRSDFFRGLSPGEELYQYCPDPREVVIRRVLLVNAPIRNHREAYAKIQAFKRRFGLKQNMGCSFPVRDPYFKGFPVFAWSELYAPLFVRAQDGLVFDSCKRYQERERTHPNEFREGRRILLQACDWEEGHLPREQVTWKILVLFEGKN